MTVIEIGTDIASDIDKCFDLTRDIDIHKLSTGTTNEKAIADGPADCASLVTESLGRDLTIRPDI